MRHWAAAIALALTAVSAEGLGILCYGFGWVGIALRHGPVWEAFALHRLPVHLVFAGLFAAWLIGFVVFVRWVRGSSLAWLKVGIPSIALAYFAVQTFRFNYACNIF